MSIGKKFKIEGGHKKGHSNMTHWEHTEDIKIKAKKKRECKTLRKMANNNKNWRVIPHADAFVLSVLSGVPVGRRRVVYQRLGLATKLGRSGMSIAKKLLQEEKNLTRLNKDLE